MRMRSFNATDAPCPSGGYAQAVDVAAPARIVFVSGQIPVTGDGQVPKAFGDQCRLVWTNVAAQLAAADMTMGNIVKVTTYLSDRRFGDENGAIRREVLGSHRPALTVIIADIFDEAWLLEIEVTAAA